MGLSNSPPVGPAAQLASQHRLLAIQLLLILALTGFVCTHKIQAEEECLSSTVLCYECDSRADPNCADPFEFPAGGALGPPHQSDAAQQPPVSSNLAGSALTTIQVTQAVDANNSSPSANATSVPPKVPKRPPQVLLCHGCCVKLTSKQADGVTSYVRRTCTSNLQINYFMVGLVCMKESGDRGKMCFCENDYCNGKPSNLFASSKLLVCLSVVAATILQLHLPTAH